MLRIFPERSDMVRSASDEAPSQWVTATMVVPVFRFTTRTISRPDGNANCNVKNTSLWIISHIFRRRKIINITLRSSFKRISAYDITTSITGKYGCGEGELSTSREQ